MLKGTIIEERYYDFLGRFLTPILVKLKLEPNHLSLLGLFFSIVAGISYVYSPFLGGTFTLLSGLMDTLDGSLARTTGKSKKAGAFLDSVLDRYTELFIFLGIWGYFYRINYAVPLVSVLIILILFGSLMVSYTRARAEGLGEKCIVGLFQRGERIIILGCAGLVYLFFPHPMVLFVTLWIFLIGTNATAFWRFAHVLKKLKQRD
ncbi:MAG: CDP-alcohol phosphatidyltransferase family protein [Thermodesulforhabdaceae bacterium]|jgi:CDP-diacylglycerol--glycerol-3-phosphate 3-phosphatidyltransferase